MPPVPQSSRNPALLVAAGTRARLELARGITADVVRGAHAGPVLWLWAPRGAEDPSLQQALGELRDGLVPGEVRGAVGFLLDGPAPPLGREAHAQATALRAMAQGAAGLVLLAGAPLGLTTFAHAACDLARRGDRRLAEELDLPVVISASQQPRLNRELLDAPLAWLIAGESDRLSHAVIDEAVRALGALLRGAGIVPGGRSIQRRALIRRLLPVELEGPGLIVPALTPGVVVERGSLVATVGEPGQVERRQLRAPTSGTLLYVASGWQRDGAAAWLGRPAVSTDARPTDSGDEIGWCELVDLPDLGVARLPAKIDTGARTSALHVHGRRVVGRERGRTLLEIELPAGEGAPTGELVRARVEVVELASIRDSGGHAERRPVIETTLRIGDRARRVRVSLTDRGDMRFPMLVGRTALEPRTRIAPTRSFITRPSRGRKPR